MTWTKGDEPVRIRDCNGFEEMLRAGVLDTELSASGLKTLGIMLDADEQPEQRWKRVRDRLENRFPTAPREMSANGVIHEEDGLRVGVWIMPDNVGRGMLETFLLWLLPANGVPLLDHARTCREDAKTRYQAPFKPTHADKALVHTWLAWQDPPGRQTHDALAQRILSADSPRAEPFVRWFCALFQV